jgi:hypothetical protein
MESAREAGTRVEVDAGVINCASRNIKALSLFSFLLLSRISLPKVMFKKKDGEEVKQRTAPPHFAK